MTKTEKSKFSWAIWWGPIVCLLLALGDMPYGYYQLLRVILFCASVYLIIQESKQDSSIWLWVLIASALIYNPIATLSLGREIWTFVNLLTVGLFGLHFRMRRHVISAKPNGVSE